MNLIVPDPSVEKPDQFFNREQRRKNMAKARSHMKTLAVEVANFRVQAASLKKDYNQKLAQIYVDYYDANKDLHAIALSEKFLELQKAVKSLKED